VGLLRVNLLFASFAGFLGGHFMTWTDINRLQLLYSSRDTSQHHRKPTLRPLINRSVNEWTIDWNENTSHQMTAVLRSLVKWFVFFLIRYTLLKDKIMYWNVQDVLHKVCQTSGCRMDHCEWIMIYRMIKKSLCTWWLQYRKLQVMFKVSPAILQTFIDTTNCVLEDREIGRASCRERVWS
jgi:hypothetical protein